MNKLEAIEAEVQRLSREEALELLDWLADFLERDMPVSAEFAASIERGRADLREGRVRIHTPAEG
jgi:predicted component of type VI protein secretion system